MKFKRQFGEIIPGLKIHGQDANYPVINERSVRAGAGVMLIIAIPAFFLAFLNQQYQLLNIVIILFFLEFTTRVFINPNYAPLYAIGKFLIRKQKPEYVGAIQKQFAWSLGAILAGSMIFIVLLSNITGALPFTICLLCLTFLWAESTLGICIGCKMYNTLIKLKILNPKAKAACPGGACTLPKK